MRVLLNPIMECNSFLKTVFCYIVGSKPRFAKFLPFLAKKMRSASNPLIDTTRSLKVCFAQFCVDNSVLLNRFASNTLMKFVFLNLGVENIILLKFY